MTFHQMATVACILCLVLAVIGAALAGVDADIGVLSLACAAVLTFIDPRAGAEAIKRIDWSTVLLVGGLLTFVGVLQKSGAVDMLGHLATTVSTPLVTALFICVVGGLVSAFASTTGILAALVPLALPVISAGGLSGWALISSLAVCASLVDLSPYSTTGATVVASGSEDQRQRLTTLMTRWGFALVILGPLVLVGLLVAPASLGK
jgi:di/tricarboxylate transporter